MKILLYFLYLLGLLLLVLLPDYKYSWMSGAESNILIDHERSDRSIILTLTFVISLASQIALLFLPKGKLEKYLIITLLLLTIIFFFIKFPLLEWSLP